MKKNKQPYLSYDEVLKNIDELFVPLFIAINKLDGIQTTACCSGHGYLPSSAPYITFLADVDIARIIHFIFENSMDEFYFYYTISGSFGDKGDLKFTITCSERNFKFYHMFRWKRHLISDLLKMVDILEQKMLCYKQ